MNTPSTQRQILRLALAAVPPFRVGDLSNGGKYVTLTVVPEPTATAFGLLAMGGLLPRRRRD